MKDVTMFRKRSMKNFYDALHGITKANIQLSDVVEIMAHCVINGEVDKDSKFESRLYDNLLEQLTNMKVSFRKNTVKVNQRIIETERKN